MTTLAASSGNFGTVLKLSWNESWNGLGLSPRDVAAIMMALVHAPGLGNEPRVLPAPIYWADGIARADDGDLRFRGQPVVFW